jgi:Ca2+-binding RTX toxin-like protein
MDYVVGAAGADRIASEGNATLLGGAGRDVITGFAERGEKVVVDGGADGDRVKTDDGDDELTGGPGADALTSGGGRDLIDARDGERDLVDCGRGRDRVRADGVDRVKRCEVRL